MSTTTATDPDVTKEAADVAMKTWTLYFLVTAIIMGVLLFAAIRKASRVCCWHFMYGSKYIRDDKEDPRMPANLFRAPSVLNTLQDHYDKQQSIRSKSDVTSYGYVTARDIEFGEAPEPDDENTRVHRFLDTMESGEGIILEHPHSLTEDPTDSTVRSLGSAKSETEADIETDGASRQQSGSVSASEQDDNHQQTESEATIEMMEFDPNYGTLGGASAYSNDTLRSTASDDAPLVSMNPVGERSSKMGRFKKNTAATTRSTVSSRTASAKSSKRLSKMPNVS